MNTSININSGFKRMARRVGISLALGAVTLSLAGCGSVPVAGVAAAVPATVTLGKDAVAEVPAVYTDVKSLIASVNSTNAVPSATLNATIKLGDDVANFVPNLITGVLAVGDAFKGAPTTSTGAVTAIPAPATVTLGVITH